jgi:benzoate-CoA ligase family protein
MEPHEVNVDRSKPVPELSFGPVFNASVALVDRHLTLGRGGKVMAKTQRGDMTYAELADGTNRMANVLRGLGVQKGDRVLLLVTDSPAFYFAFLGAIRLGAIAVLASTYLRRADYAYMLGESAARVVVASPVVFPELQEALKEPEVKVERVIATADAPPGWLALDDLLKAAGVVSIIEPTTAKSECFWLYSSGSTGKPKAAVHQHKDLIYAAVMYAEGILGLNENDVIFSVGKLFFAYGINNSLGFPLWAGATVILLEERANAENSLAVMSAEKPSIYFTVPTMLVAQAAAIENGTPADLSSLRVCVCGGEPLADALFERWKKLTGHKLIEGIGSSEVLHIYISNRIGHIKLGSLGRVVPGYEAAIRDSSGKDLPPGELGEIVIRGESVATYYWNKPEKTAECMRNGWFHTGDSGSMDADGYFYFAGRRDDMLRVGGMWVSPAEVEAALMGHPCVLEAAVVGAVDENKLTKPKAFVVLRQNNTAYPELESELIQFAKTRIASFMAPRWIEFMPDLPKTATGKIQRFRLRAGV